jgi:hypothetical protein
MPDPQFAHRLPDVELDDLARPIDRPLKGPRRRQEQRPHLAQIVINDRLASRAAQRRQQLAHAHPRQLGVLAQQPVDLILNGSSTRGCGAR